MGKMVKPEDITIKSSTEDIVKPLQDNRGYRGLVLGNDLKILLISDPDVEKAAAALDVNIGCMSDPWKLQGLAHFLEHMLFMGTTKYPEENAFEKYVSEHGGQYNACTMEEHTNFHFDVASDFLVESLDRFAQFFISPLLTESGTEREVNAVNSEHENNLTDDRSRLDHINRATGDPKHDFNKFGTGNKDTLWFNPVKEGVSVRAELLKFHDTYYSSNIMSLVVIGKESLDELSDIVVRLFRDVPNKQVKVPHWTEVPFKEEHLRMQLKVVPVSDIRSLSIIWTIPDLFPFYKTKPGQYLGGLIGHEGPGSLLSALKAKGWANTLFAGETEGAEGFQFFTVSVSLTEDGLVHTDEIIELIFQYLRLLRQAGPQERIWREEQKIQAMRFRYRDKDKAMEYALGLGILMQKYSMPELLTGSVLLTEYDPAAITDLLALLTPDKMRISIMSKSFKDIATKKEKFYGVNYALSAVSEERIAAWEKVGHNADMALPPPNEFIPERFDILSPPVTPQSVPALIRKTQYSRLWHLQDVEHKLPKANALFEICSPVVYKDPLHALMAHVFVEMFRDAVNESVYAPGLAEMTFDLKQSQYGFVLEVAGYDDKLDVLLHMLIEKLVTFKPDEKRFHIWKEETGRKLKNFFATEPSRQSEWYFNVLMCEACYTKEDLIAALDELSFATFSGLVMEIFQQVYVEGFVCGNVSRKKAELLLEQVEGALRNAKSSPIAPVSRQRLLKLADGSEFVYHRENNIHKSSSVATYYQCAHENPRLNMLLGLFEQITNEPCFDILRTKEQLGYIVFSTVKNLNGVLGLQVLVQSHRTPEHVDQRIENFIREMQPFVSSLTEAEFKMHVEALAAHKLEKPKTIAERAEKAWKEIFSRQYNFDRDRLEVEELRRITPVDLNAFISEYLLPGGAKRKKFTIHITSTAPAGVRRPRRSVEDMDDGESDEDEDEDADYDDEEEGSGDSDQDMMSAAPGPENLPATEAVPAISPAKICEAINDVAHFKKTMGFHPLPPVYIDINTVATD